MKIIFPHSPGIGGPGSFQSRFEKEIVKRDWQVEYAHSGNQSPNLIFIVGGTKRLGWLLKMKRKKIPIIYRLDGINWLHREKWSGIKNFLTAEYRNWNNKIIHAFIADHIVYQSEFVAQWWNRDGLVRRKNYSIVHNGVDIEIFKPIEISANNISIVCLEGTLDYSPYSIILLNQLRAKLPPDIEIKLYGRFENPLNENKLSSKIKYIGPIQRDEVPSVFNHSIYLSLDVNPACPNTVIEALACGTPVVGFDTGALKELVHKGCGEIVPYGSDPWKLKMPDVDSLTQAILKVRQNYNYYSTAAREYAVREFDVQKVFSKYVDIMKSVNTDHSYD